MGGPCETASFRVDDAESLVAASLACPACLSGAIDWSLDVREGYDASVDCACRGCGHRRRVFVRPDQALRLSLHERRPLDPTPRPEDVRVALL